MRLSLLKCVANQKPNPNTFLHCTQLIKVNPVQCLVFEDADLDTQAGLEERIDVFHVHNQQLICAK